MASRLPQIFPIDPIQSGVIGNLLARGRAAGDRYLLGISDGLNQAAFPIKYVEGWPRCSVCGRLRAWQVRSLANKANPQIKSGHPIAKERLRCPQQQNC